MASVSTSMEGRGRGRGRGRIAPGMRPVTEENRISIAEQLEGFRASDATEYKFPPNLSNHDRAVVHDLCQKLGLKSKSYGKGEGRAVHVFKPKSTVSLINATPLPFTIESQAAMLELFLNYPPTEEELKAALGETDMILPPPSTPTNKRGASSSTSYAPEKRVRNKSPVVGAADVARQAGQLADRLKKMPGLQALAQERARLPIAGYEKEITETIAANQVTLIAGETGCGKTTQVPQFVLDHCWRQGQRCRILCTQPRRISAATVAERVAAERGEIVGESVGYQIRLESVGSSSSSLMFCTNGILLRKLTGAARSGPEEDLSIDATHIIIDEIHERDRYADFLLIILRDLLPKRPDLRLVLMSATFNADLFARYFGGCPVVKVPGFTHPVKSYYLEDILVLTGYFEKHKPRGGESEAAGTVLEEADAEAMDDALTRAWLEDDFDPLMELVAYGDHGPSNSLGDYQHSETGATALMVAAGKGRGDDVAMLLSMGASTRLQSFDGGSAADWAERFEHPEIVEQIQKHEEGTAAQQAANTEAAVLRKYQASVDAEDVDVSLIIELLEYIAYGKDLPEVASDGAVLVFLPGWEDISRLKERLAAHPLFGDPKKFLLLPLHSMVPSIEQKKVFQRPPGGVQKVVLATNIAETAVTIDDVVFVIDSGRHKEKNYDPYSNVSTLQSTWVSKASARQREGRAGRCRPGVCYHLFSKVRQNAMAEFQVPELKRTPLEELGLQVKLLDPQCKIRDFIAKAVEPPLDQAVANAVALLVDIGALETGEKVTRLGRHLASLPLHPATGKMLLHAVLLECLDPILTVACGANYREPFVLPMAPDQKRRAIGARYSLTECYGGGSDHLALVAAFNGWRSAKGAGREQEFCTRYFVSGATMQMLAGMRLQLQAELALRGFIPRVPNDAPTPCNANGLDPGLVRGVLAAGMYPLVGSLLPQKAGGVRSALIVTARDEKVRLHPHSVNHRLESSVLAGAESSASSLLVFDEIMRGEALMYIRSSTVVQPHALVLFAAEMAVAPLEFPTQESPAVTEEEDAEGGLSDEEQPLPRPPEASLFDDPQRQVAVVVDRWLRFQTTALEAAQLYCMRERLFSTFAYKIKHPSEPLPHVFAAALYSTACLLSAEGTSYAPVPVTAPPDASTLLHPRYPSPARGRGRGQDWGLAPGSRVVGRGRGADWGLGVSGRGGRGRAGGFSRGGGAAGGQYSGPGRGGRNGGGYRRGVAGY